MPSMTKFLVKLANKTFGQIGHKWPDYDQYDQVFLIMEGMVFTSVMTSRLYSGVDGCNLINFHYVFAKFRHLLRYNPNLIS